MIDLNCHAIHKLIKDADGSGFFEDAELAAGELVKLQTYIKSLKEQQARTDKVLADSVHGVKQTLAWNKRLDELQAENKRLVEEIKSLKYAAYDAAVEAAHPKDD